MRVNVISDLHLEFDDLVLPGGDVLILSGDVLEAKNLKQENYSPDAVAVVADEHRRSDRYARFFNEECAKYRKVIYVMGNHEHYGYTFDKTYNQLKGQLPQNVTLLEKESVEIDGVIFVGGTLWTDMNNADALTLYHLRAMMNDFRVIWYNAKGRKFRPEDAYHEHVQTKNYISSVATANPDKTVVVVTHHSPSRKSTKPRYEDDFHMNGGYSSSLEEFIMDHPNIKFWTHGHTHDTFDYMIEQCRIVCNPRGYVGYEERAKEFDPTVGFDV